MRTYFNTYNNNNKLFASFSLSDIHYDAQATFLCMF